MIENQKKYSVSTIIITAIAIIIILVLAFLFYDYSIKPISLAPLAVVESSGVKTTPPLAPPVQIIPTNVIRFLPPEILPAEQKSGYCWVSSIAEPFRTDAFRCMVGNLIYDPCFSTIQKGFVYCQTNTDSSTGFLIKLTKPLPSPEVPKVVQNNWAWFLMLRDGTYCSPFTGTRPFFGQGPSAEVAYYACDSINNDQQVVLLGDITAGNVWTAEEAFLVKDGTNWVVASSQKADIDTIWQ
jgi:hypothetical protein